MSDVQFSSFFNGADADMLFGVAYRHAAGLAAWVEAQYADSPELVLSLGVAFSLPAIATTGVLLRSLLASRKRRRYEFDAATQHTRPASLWRQRAALELTSANAREFVLGQGIVRIGRETDNDLCLPDPAVHRYHAVIEQTPEAEFVISYVGDPNSNGMHVDGHPVTRQRLRGGEILLLGATKLRFTMRSA
ncbi:MAG: FHA domain-containing protein [Alphaproteobacteria bacterium]|nr:FHA domain-containing protein [Alphaproteobacteria bacterium]